MPLLICRRVDHIKTKRPLKSPEKPTVRASDVSRNVSLLLESLLDAYDRQHRPNNLGGPTVVRVHMLIRSMGPISELDMVSAKSLGSTSLLIYSSRSFIRLIVTLEFTMETMASLSPSAHSIT